MPCRPDRATGSRARITVQEETCWGQLATGQEAYGVEFVSETLQNQINKIQSQLIRPDRMNGKSQQGNHRPGGDIVGELQPHGPWPLFLKHVLGGSVVTTGSYPYVHTFAGGSALPEGLTLEKKFGFPSSTTKLLRYLGSRVNEVEIGATQEGQVTARASFISQQEAEVTTEMDATPTYPTDNEPFNSFHGSMLLDRGNGVRVAISTLSTISMLFANNIDGDQFALDGLKYRADAPEGVRQISGNMTAFFTSDNWALYQAFRENTSLSLELWFVRGPWSMQFTIFGLTLGGTTPQVPDRNSLNLVLPWEAHRDDVTGLDVRVAITNKENGIHT